MRKTLPIQEQKLFELFGNFDYKLPKDPELILYDFYFLTAFGNEVSGRNMNANYAIEEASNKIVDMLYIHMKNAVFYAICAEIRHLFDYFRKADLKDRISKQNLEFLQEYYIQLMNLNNLTSNMAIGLGIDIVDEIDHLSKRDRTILTGEDQGSRLKSYKAIKATMKKLNYSQSKFAIWAEDMFNEDGWSSSYGGKPWASIAEALYKLERAGKKQEKIIWIDHAYDLQHNTDTVFNKLKLYYKDGGYRWIKKALDWKRDVTDLRDFYKKVSTQLRPMVAYISKATTGKSIISAEDEEENKAIAKTRADLQGSENNINIRRDNSGGYKFKIDDVVKIDSNKNPFLAVDDEVIQWGLENGITFGLIDSLNLTDDFKIIAIGEHQKFPGIVVAIIQPNGSHNSYLVNVDGIKKKPTSNFGTHNSDDFNFNLGDEVFISDADEVFPKAVNWAYDHNFTIISGKTPDPEHDFTIIARDTIDDQIGYGIRDQGTKQNYVVGEDGLEKIPPKPNNSQPVQEFYMDISNYSNSWNNVKLRESNASYVQDNIDQFKWLKNASISDARLKLSPNKQLVFESGVWHSGTWKEGIFAGGIWESGKWIDGTWNPDAQWQSGEILSYDGSYEYSSEPPE